MPLGQTQWKNSKARPISGHENLSNSTSPRLRDLAVRLQGTRKAFPALLLQGTLWKPSYLPWVGLGQGSGKAGCNRWCTSGCQSVCPAAEPFSAAPEPRRCGGEARRGSADQPAFVQTSRNTTPGRRKPRQRPEKRRRSPLCLQERVCIGVRSPRARSPAGRGGAGRRGRRRSRGPGAGVQHRVGL